MAPTEVEVLTNHLIRPAPLDAIVTYEWFASLFPPARRGSDQVRQLWRDLEAQRERALARVRANIEDEVRRGLAMRREILAARREAALEEEDVEIETERVVSLIPPNLFSNFTFFCFFSVFFFDRTLHIPLHTCL